MDNNQFLLRRIIYDPEADFEDENCNSIQAINYSDSFIETIVAKINEGLQSS